MDIQYQTSKLYGLEQLAQGKTVVHSIHPGVKLMLTLAYILVVMSIHPYELFQVIPFVVIPVLVMLLGEVPMKAIFEIGRAHV